MADDKVGRLLDVKREDAKAKRAAVAASGVVARRARAAARRRRRSQVERELVLKRADELLEQSGKAEEIRQRRVSLGTLRPEDVRVILERKPTKYFDVPLVWHSTDFEICKRK